MLCFIAMTIVYIICSCYLGLIDGPIVVPEGMCSLGYEEYNKGQASDKSGPAESRPYWFGLVLVSSNVHGLFVKFYL